MKKVQKSWADWLIVILKFLILLVLSYMAALVAVRALEMVLKLFAPLPSQIYLLRGPVLVSASLAFLAAVLLSRGDSGDGSEEHF